MLAVEEQHVDGYNQLCDIVSRAVCLIRAPPVGYAYVHGNESVGLRTILPAAGYYDAALQPRQLGK